MELGVARERERERRTAEGGWRERERGGASSELDLRVEYK